MAIDLIIRRVIEGAGLSVADREKLIDQIISALRFEFGGLRVYINSREKINIEQLRREFNGRNVRELSEKYQITNRRVYQIINASD